MEACICSLPVILLLVFSQENEDRKRRGKGGREGEREAEHAIEMCLNEFARVLFSG